MAVNTKFSKLERIRWVHCVIPFVSATIACDPKVDSKNRQTVACLQGQSQTEQKYSDKISSGEILLKNKKIDSAISLFREALNIPLHEIPNYEPYLYIAEAYCLRGSKREGRLLLSEFDCMLNIDKGKTQCYGDKTNNSLPNKALPQACFERMCGEIFLEYYEKPTNEHSMKMSALTSRYKHAELVCK